MHPNTDLADFLANHTGDLRLALDALVACLAAERAAWVANGSPTDGTKDRLQRILSDAADQASTYVRLAAERDPSVHHGAAKCLADEARRLFAAAQTG